MDSSMPGLPAITNSWSSLKLRSIESVMPSSHLTLCCPLLLLPSIFPSIRVFSNDQFFASDGQSIGVSGLSISTSNEYSGLIFFRMDRLDLSVVQGTLKSLLQHHSSKASILWRSAFFIVQLSYPHMTTGKNHSFTRWTFVGRVMFSAFQHAVYVGPSFSSKEQASFNSMAAVTTCSDFGAPKNKV